MLQLKKRVLFKAHLHDIRFGHGTQNFGTRADSFGHGPLDLHGKICSSFFNVGFWNGTPETRTVLLDTRDESVMNPERLSTGLALPFTHKRTDPK